VPTGHPDHIAICQFTTAAIVAAADPAFAFEGVDTEGQPHVVGTKPSEVPNDLRDGFSWVHAVEMLVGVVEQ
jgi:LmbE family N-acetylglucosaminyl deacetylase